MRTPASRSRSRTRTRSTAPLAFRSSIVRTARFASASSTKTASCKSTRKASSLSVRRAAAAAAARSTRPQSFKPATSYGSIKAARDPGSFATTGERSARRPRARPSALTQIASPFPVRMGARQRSGLACRRLASRRRSPERTPRRIGRRTSNSFLPDKRGFIPGGLDDMGNVAAGKFASVPVIAGNVTTPGSRIGEALNTLDTSRKFRHTTTPRRRPTRPRSHRLRSPARQSERHGGGNSLMPLRQLVQHSTGTAVITTTIANSGGGGAHNNTPLTVLGTFYRKL
jgi:hypothetical protein